MSSAKISHTSKSEAKRKPQKLKRGTAEYWSDRVSRPFGHSVRLLIIAGTELLHAKEDLEHGEWMRMFNENLVQISLREAERLMNIAKNPELSNSTNWSNLPKSPRSLYALSKAEPKRLLEGIKSGVVNAGMTITEANEFATGCVNSGVSASVSRTPNFNLEKSIAKCESVILGEQRKCPSDQTESFRKKLQSALTPVVNATSSLGSSEQPETDPFPQAAGSGAPRKRPLPKRSSEPQKLKSVSGESAPSPTSSTHEHHVSQQAQAQTQSAPPGSSTRDQVEHALRELLARLPSETPSSMAQSLLNLSMACTMIRDRPAGPGEVANLVQQLAAKANGCPSSSDPAEAGRGRNL